MDNVLTDKQYRNYEYTSRYSQFPVYYNIKDQKYIYGLTGQLKLNDDISTVLYEVQPGDTLDSLALNFYGRPDYFWIIADYNRIKDSLIQLYGKYKTLIIPSMIDVEFTQQVNNNAENT